MSELLAEDHSGFAVDPTIPDPTTVLVALYARMAPRLLAGGAIHHWATHVCLEPLGMGRGNLGFGRIGAYGSQPARPVRRRRASPSEWGRVMAWDRGTVRRGNGIPFHAADLRLAAATVTRARRESSDSCSLPEPCTSWLASNMRTSALSPSSSPPHHRGTAPRVSPLSVQPPPTRPTGQGVGGALVDAALDWSDGHGFHTVSVDFDSANPVSRPFWLGAGFTSVGYQVARSIHPAYLPGGGTADTALLDPATG